MPTGKSPLKKYLIDWRAKREILKDKMKKKKTILERKFLVLKATYISVHIFNSQKFVAVTQFIV